MKPIDVNKYFKRVINITNNNTYAHYWQSNRLSNEKLNAPGTNSSNDQAPIIQYNNARISVYFSGDCLKQNKVAYIHGKIVNIYIVYRLTPHTASNTDFTLNYCLFGAVKLTNSDPGKYNYAGYSIGFDSRGTFTHPDGDYGVKVIIFGCDVSNSSHANNRANDILILGRSLVEELNGKTLYAEKMYSPNFTVTNKTFVLSLHYNGVNSYFFVNGKEVAKFKAKDSEIKPYQLCLGNISKDFSLTNA